MIATLLEPRHNTTTPPLNLGYATIVAAMPWVSRFVVYSGSQLATEGGAAMALKVTNIFLVATASLTWTLWQHKKHGKVSLMEMVTGAIACILRLETVNLIRDQLKVDDTSDVFTLDGVDGVCVTIMILVFGMGSWSAQLASLTIVGAFIIVITFVLVKPM